MGTEHEVDVVIVGGGLGGLAGAVSAASAGLSVVILEKSQWVGGGAAYSGGLCWIPGLEDDSLGAAHAYIRYAQGERSFDDDLLEGVLRAMADSAAHYRICGVGLEIVPDNPDVYYPQAPGSVSSGRMWECVQDGGDLGSWRRAILPTPHYRIGMRHSELFQAGLTDEERETMFAEREQQDLLTMGPGLAGSFAHAALVRFGVPCVTDTEVVSLVVEGKRVTGVHAQNARGVVEWRARRGVLLATGGYGWSPDARDLEGLPDLVEAGPPSISGDHLRLAGSVGAAVARAGDPQFSMGAQILPNDKHPGTDVPVHLQMFDVMGKPHSLVVNRYGQRFGDESYYVGINEAVREWDAVAKKWINFPCYLVIDEQFRRKYSLGSVPAGQEYPSSIARADSLEELAGILGLPASALCETVTRFNKFAGRGIDVDFGRGDSAFIRRRYGDPNHEPNANLGEVAKPPFYGVPLRPLGFGICSLGLVTDRGGRVQRRDGAAIEGLYATGNAVATTEFRGYVTGYANSRNMALAHASVQSMLTTADE